MLHGFLIGVGIALGLWFIFSGAWRIALILIVSLIVLVPLGIFTIGLISELKTTILILASLFTLY
jgi:hypothetical protein